MPRTPNATARALATLVAVLPLLAGADPVAAQTGNPWTEQYGNQSILLGGAVIGSASDLGLVFYNPARLALVQDPDFVVTARVYQWQRSRLEDGLDGGVELEDSRFGPAPGMTAVAFTVPFLPGHRFAYSFLTRRREESDALLRAERSGDILEAYPGEEFFAGTFEVSSGYDESWIGLTWAHTLGSRWGLGASAFYAATDRRARLDLDLRAVTAADAVLALSRTRGFRIRDHGVVVKTGIAAAFPPAMIGLTVTTPRVNVVSSARIHYEDLVSGAGDVLVTGLQGGLRATTRSPWAVGAGVGVELGSWTVHAAAEWYSAVPHYVVAAMQPFTGQSTGEPVEYRVVEELRSVLNGAAGIQWKGSDRLSLYGSIGTNKSAAPDDPSPFLELGNEVSTVTYRTDFLQVGGGVVMSTSYLDLTLGASYGRGADVAGLPFDYLAGQPGAGLGGEETTRLVVSRWRVLLGLTLPFADRLKDLVD